MVKTEVRVAKDIVLSIHYPRIFSVIKVFSYIEDTIDHKIITLSKYI